MSTIRSRVERLAGAVLHGGCPDCREAAHRTVWDEAPADAGQTRHCPSCGRQVVINYTVIRWEE